MLSQGDCCNESDGNVRRRNTYIIIYMLNARSRTTVRKTERVRESVYRCCVLPSSEDGLVVECRGDTERTGPAAVGSVLEITDFA